MAVRLIRSFRADETSIVFENGTRVLVPRVAGELKQLLPAPGENRLARIPAERDSPLLSGALAEHGILEEEVLCLDLLDAPEQNDDVAVVFPGSEVPRDWRRVLLYRDESGGFSWHFPDKETPASQQTFTIRLRTAAARRSLRERRTTAMERGTITQLGRKLLRVLLVPIAKVLSNGALSFAAEWERRQRRDRLRAVTADDYSTADAQDFADFSRLTEGRALLILHDVFGSTNGMLGRLPRRQMEELAARYDGRIVAYDHLTLSRSPAENAQQFLAALRGTAPRQPFNFDILCHGRGGIVARTLRERLDDLGGGEILEIRKIFFVASPNHGSALADPNHIVDMIDVFTNLITDFPGGPVAYSMEVLLALVTIAASPGNPDLPGLRDMQPKKNGYIEGVLNARVVSTVADYAAAVSNYEPRPERDNGFLTGPFANRIAGDVFGGENDLVVPADGVFQRIGAQERTLEDVYKTDASHAGFFADPSLISRALAHFAKPHALDAPNEDRYVRRGARGFDDESEIPNWLTDPEIDAVDSSRGLAFERMAPEPAPAAGEVQREPEILFHEVVEAGVPNDLQVVLSQLTGRAGASQVKIAFAPGQTEVEVRVHLFAPGFEVRPSEVLPMTVKEPRDPSSETVTFSLTANSVTAPTDRTIIADFSVGMASIGGVSHVTQVIPPGTGANPNGSPPFLPSFRAAAADREQAQMKVSVSSIEEGGEPPFLMLVSSTVPNFSYLDYRVGKFSPKQNDIVKYLQTMIVDNFSKRPDAGDPAYETALAAWNRSFGATIDTLGTELWEWLPDLFKKLYFEHVDRKQTPASIQIVSDDLYFPWELAIPWRDTPNGRETLAPLGAAHVIGRWRPGLPTRPEPQRYALTHVELVSPEYQPPYALRSNIAEAQELGLLFGGIADVVKPADEPTMTAVLNRADVQLFHFSGHANFNENNADASYLLLSDENPLKALTFAAAKLTSGHPIVVLNACSVGMLKTIVASRAGGFAAKCLERGCSGVVAAYWPIADGKAKEFALALYRKLKFGHSIGEALQELRAERTDDPTYRAYTFFGDPLTRLLF